MSNDARGNDAPNYDAKPGNMTFEGHDDGRDDLRAWREAQPANAYEADTHFRSLVPLYAKDGQLDDLERELSRFGVELAGPVDELVRRNNLNDNMPRLDRYTGIGERIEQVYHHPTYHAAGRYIYGSGVMAAYADHPNTFGVASRMYLSSTNGEAGHNCPLACTAGVIRVLQELGTPEMQDRWLPGFLDRDYDKHLEGAQFMTEIQGGSDVGRNASRAVKQDDGSYRIWGEKWFCSNIDGDVFLMTARIVDDNDEPVAEGTRGLGLFFVPRKLDDGQVNHFHIRRLKEKIGTRSMASGEADFRGAVGWHMGPEEEGFKNMMRLVINTSRLFNALACMGLARRAYVTAQTYAQHRVAFDRPIAEYPLIQETLANVKAEIDACVSGTMHLCWLRDRMDAGESTEQIEQFFRMALNLNKVRTAKSARWASVEGIEVLGGNGAIETFSVLPRLLRDSIVTENWEGTHNTLQMQIMRDMQKYRVHEGYFGYISTMLDGAVDADAERVGRVREHIGQLMEGLAGVGKLDLGQATLAMRPLMDRLAWVQYAATRIWERGQKDERGQSPATGERDDASLDHFIEFRLDGTVDRTSDDYLARIREISSAL